MLVLLVCMQDWLVARYLVMAYRDKSLLVDSQGCSEAQLGGAAKECRAESAVDRASPAPADVLGGHA